MKIDRADMRVRVSIPHKEAKIVHDRLKALFKTVEVENWEEGDLEMVGFCDERILRNNERFRLASLILEIIKQWKSSFAKKQRLMAFWSSSV